MSSGYPAARRRSSMSRTVWARSTSPPRPRARSASGMITRNGETRTPWPSHSMTTTHSPASGRAAGRSGGRGRLPRSPPGTGGPASESPGSPSPEAEGLTGPPTSVGIVRRGWPRGPSSTALRGADSSAFPCPGTFPPCGVGGVGISVLASDRPSDGEPCCPPPDPGGPVDANGEGGSRRSLAGPLPSLTPATFGCSVPVPPEVGAAPPPPSEVPCGPALSPAWEEAKGRGGITRSLAPPPPGSVAGTDGRSIPTPPCRGFEPPASVVDVAGAP